MSDSDSALNLIVRIAHGAIEKQRERRRESGMSSDERSIEVLLLHLATIKSLAHNALPETEQALLPQVENPELVRRLKQELLEAADECRVRRRAALH